MSDMTLDEAKAAVIKLFIEIQAAGVDVVVENWMGHESLDLIEPGSQNRVKLGNQDWHPEWSMSHDCPNCGLPRDCCCECEDEA